MATYRHTLIAREGWLLIFISLLAAVLVYFIFNTLAAIPFVIVALLLVFLFRDPPRKIPSSPLGVVSPVDGVVTNIETLHDKYLDREAVCLTIKMHWYGIYSTRSPMEGKVMEQWFGDERHPEVADITSAQWIQSDEGDDIVVGMQTDKITRRPGCLVHAGERIGQGQRCGFIHFGETVRVYVPVNTRIEVQNGGNVLAGSDIIATLVHKDQ